MLIFNLFHSVYALENNSYLELQLFSDCQYLYFSQMSNIYRKYAINVTIMWSKISYIRDASLRKKDRETYYTLFLYFFA